MNGDTLWTAPLTRTLVTVHCCWSEDGLVEVAFGPLGEPSATQRFSRRYERDVERDDALPAPYRDAFERYFDGDPEHFDLTLAPLGGTPFQKRVWAVLRSIPYGSVRSYGWVAKQLQRPRAARSVGAANRANPLPIVIPCHRVIRRDGTLGGYAKRPSLKRALLTLEGVQMTDDGRVRADIDPDRAHVGNTDDSTEIPTASDPTPPHSNIYEGGFVADTPSEIDQ